MNFQKLFLPHSRNKHFRKPIINNWLSVVLIVHQLLILCSEAYYLDNNPYRHKRILGPKASFVVEWSVNWKEKVILFQVSAETKGWIGFGLSKDGRMAYSDAIIGGVDSYSGKPYFNDVHIKSNRSIVVDQREDWKLIGAWEKGKRTYLSFSRAMETCDPQDYPITDDLVVFIWAFGESDDVRYHMERRGSLPVYLLDPEISEEIAHNQYRQIGPHSNLYLVQRWAATTRLRLAARPTSVWCSIQRGPTLPLRHDIVGMGAFLPTKLARLHVQTMLLYKCTSPQQTNATTFFAPYEKLQGEECFLNEKRSLPLAFCRQLIYVWGRGGQPFYFPEDIGIPIGESPEEYFLLETHFDNPRVRQDLDIEAGIEVIFSHRQKPNAASLLQIGYGSFGMFMIPPKTTMSILGSCGPQCTLNMFPKDGANAFAVMLQTHSLGRSIRLRHLRNLASEQPWIIKDDNYDSEYQQMRLLTRQVTILPGDQISTQCSYDSFERNRTSFSGFSSQDEVCSAFVYVSTRLPFFRCTSELPTDQLLQKYGISNYTWDLTWQDRYVTVPKRLEGTWLGDVVDEMNPQLKKSDLENLEADFKYGTHWGSCPNINDMMAQAQSRLFRTFTNDWQQKNDIPVATRTPHATTMVSYPKNIHGYQESPVCQRPKNTIPEIHNVVTSQSPKVIFPDSSPRTPTPSRDFSYAAVPSPARPPTQPLQHSEYSTIYDESSRQRSPTRRGKTTIFTTSNPHKNSYRPLVSESTIRSTVPTTIRSRVPKPILSSSPAPIFEEFIQKPKPSNPPENLAVPIPPPPPRPPVEDPEFSRIPYNNRNRPTPADLRFPMLHNKQPHISNDKSIMNFFDRIANMFSSSPNTKNYPQDGISYQQHHSYM